MDNSAEIAELRARLAALEGASDPPVAVAPARPSGSGWIIGAIVLGGLAMLWMSGIGAPSARPVATVAQSRVNAAAEIAALGAQLPVTLGKGSRDYGYTTYPIVVENRTGRALGYVQATCSFYDEDGDLIASEMTNWTNVAPGARASGTLVTQITGEKRYECGATTSG